MGQPAVPPPVTSVLVVDYTDEMPAVRDQGQEASSIGFALASALSFQIHKAQGIKVTISPRDIYYRARVKQGTFPADAGASFGDAADVLMKDGAVAEEVWPYEAGQITAKPAEQVASATHFKITNARRIRTVEEIKAALQKSGPVVAGFVIYDSFYGTGKTGIVPMPSKDENMLASYPVCTVGFDDNRKLFKVQTSWGANWGASGYAYLSYDYVNQFLSEAWSIEIN